MRRRIGLSCEVHVDLCRSCLRIEDVVTYLYLNGSNSKDEIKERVYTLMIHLLRILFSRLFSRLYITVILLLTNDYELIKRELIDTYVINLTYREN